MIDIRAIGNIYKQFVLAFNINYFVVKTIVKTIRIFNLYEAFHFQKKRFNNTDECFK